MGLMGLDGETKWQKFKKKKLPQKVIIRKKVVSLHFEKYDLICQK
jgi:hypothetical protein